jgi:hypothetical protein
MRRYALATYGDSYRQYMAHVPAFFPSLRWKREIAGLAFTGNARMAGHQTDGPVSEVLRTRQHAARRLDVVLLRKIITNMTKSRGRM